ncbi:TRAP transporter permease [Pseudoroseicyclus sp. CXY001]|uniref:TRAP transporter permease n=1 Tax=Pseudoroseicyclus sp. CXY001 TaxID=3242492 RepID=UPI003570C9D6
MTDPSVQPPAAQTEDDIAAGAALMVPAPTPGRGPLGVIRSILAVLAIAGPVVWVLDLPRQLFHLAPYTEQLLAYELAVILPMLFLTFDIRGRRSQDVRWHDLILAAVGCVAPAWLAWEYPRLVNDLVFLPREGVIIAALLVAISVEGVRRAIGLTLALVVLGLIAFGFWGYLLPAPYNSREMSFARLVVYLGIDTNALLGISLQVGVVVIVPFILLGKFLAAFGGSDFFSALAVAAMGRFRGGPGKIAVFGSSLMGSISGSAVANVAGTGVVTIPLMKRAGFPAHVAAGIESVASTGGQLMPPVIGAAAFLMAEFLVLPYSTVMIAALLPILLYYAAIFTLVDLYAAKKGLAGVPRAEIPALWPEFRQGWHFLLPFVVFLVGMFSFRLQPELAALWAVGTLFVTSFVFGYHGRRPTLKTIWAAIYDAGESVVEIVIVTAAAGLVIGVLNLSGIAFTLAGQLLSIAGGNVLILLIFAGISSIILGMGMPTVSVYILLAALIAPAIIQAGVEPIAAHMFVLYFGLMSMVTPPIAVASFAAANLAKAGPWATSFSAMWFGWTAYIIPFLFVFSPAMLLQGPLLPALIAAVTALAGIFFISMAAVGFARAPIGAGLRLLCLIAGAMLLPPAEIVPGGYWVVGAGALFALGLALWLFVFTPPAPPARRRDPMTPV